MSSRNRKHILSGLATDRTRTKPSCTARVKAEGRPFSFVRIEDVVGQKNFVFLELLGKFEPTAVKETWILVDVFASISPSCQRGSVSRSSTLWPPEGRTRSLALGRIRSCRHSLRFGPNHLVSWATASLTIAYFGGKNHGSRWMEGISSRTVPCPSSPGAVHLRRATPFRHRLHKKQHGAQKPMQHPQASEFQTPTAAFASKAAGNGNLCQKVLSRLRVVVAPRALRRFVHESWCEVPCGRLTCRTAPCQSEQKLFAAGGLTGGQNHLERSTKVLSCKHDSEPPLCRRAPCCEDGL